MKKVLLFTLFIFFLSVVNAQVVINEIDADTPSYDTMEFIELKTSTSNMSLDGYVLVLFNGSGDVSYLSIDLDGYSSDANGIFLIGTSTVTPSPDLVFAKSQDNIQNGADAVAVYYADATDFPTGTAATSVNLIDAVVYDTDDGDDSDLLSSLGQAAQYNENENGDKDNQSIQRSSDGSYSVAEPTVGVLNDGSGVTSPTITISTNQVMYGEGDAFDIIFTSSVAVESDLVINYTLVNGSFDASDYSGDLSVTILTGNTSASSTISIIDDTDDEGDESLIVSIVNLDENYQAFNTNYSITIEDNDYSSSDYGTPLNPTYGVISSTAPEGYYNTLDGLSGQNLKSAITAIISNSSEVRAQTYGDVWDMLKEADENPENNNQVWLLYTEQGRNKSEQQGSGTSVGKWNREHIYPQSRGGFTDGTSTSADGIDIYMTTDATHTEHAHSDAHSLRPADSYENTIRSNSDYGEEYDGSDGNAGSWKGDVARSLFYMALRYNDLGLIEGNPDNTTVGFLGDLSYLLTWDKADIPDDYEMHRNNVIYIWQHNRNPFIDLPELVDYVYGDKQDQIFNLTTDINDVNLTDKQASVYLNQSAQELVLVNVEVGSKLKVYSIEGSLVKNISYEGSGIDISTLSKGIYIYILDTAQQNISGKIMKNF